MLTAMEFAELSSGLQGDPMAFTPMILGNLDPMRLVAGGRALDEGVDRILETLGDGPLVFNLGHGITPQTPIENVERMIARVRQAGWS